MKQSTQKLLARLLVLLLVLGLMPEMWEMVGSAANTGTPSEGANYVYYYSSDTNTSSVSNGVVNLSSYYNGTTSYPNSRTLCVVQDGKVRTDVTWSLSGTTYNTNTGISNGIVSLSYNSTTGIATITGLAYGNCYVYAYVGNAQIASCLVYVDNYTYSGSTMASVVVSGSYYLGDTDANGNSSIVSQLDSYNYAGSGYYRLAYVRFTNVSGTYGSLNASVGTNYCSDYYYSSTTTYKRLSDVLFTPNSSTSTGISYFGIQAYYYTGTTSSSISTTPITGTIAIDSRGGTTVSVGDITYTAAIGEDVPFDIGDFEDFYYNSTSRGTLKYVTFTVPSGGSLYSDRGRLSSGASCYVSPTSSQNDLAGVYFTPTGTTATKAGSVRISFTAYGSSTTRTGTVVINYINGSAPNITYTTTSSGTVSLRASDFTSAYRTVVGTTAPTGLTIQFQNVPAHGSLSYKGTSSTVRLTSSNIGNYKFTTRTTGTYQLSDVTYTASGTLQDTIEYTAYNGSTPVFTGKVVFNGTSSSQTVTVYCTSSAGVNLSSSAFTAANATMMQGTTKIWLGAPTYGTLTYSGATVSSTGVSVPVGSLSMVTYRPNAGFNGTDRLDFICSDASGNVMGSGQMVITVSGNTTTSSSSTVTDISQFTDVPDTPGNAWYRPQLADLVRKGIMSGKGDGKFDPTGDVKYGEALKMVLRAAGYTAEEVPGDNWAINYKALAVSRGWISSDIDLTAAISRNAVAELAARVLGIPASSSANPFTDNANNYAVALYYTSPQILEGTVDSNGQRHFYGGDTLQRAEICVIIYRMNSYVLNINSNQKPDGI